MSTTTLPALLKLLSHGICLVDSGIHRDDFDIAYLVVHGPNAVFIDTGTNHAVPRLLAAVKTVGLSVEDHRVVIFTHVHLDQAGGVGTLMRALPRWIARMAPWWQCQLIASKPRTMV